MKNQSERIKMKLSTRFVFVCSALWSCLACAGNVTVTHHFSGSEESMPTSDLLHEYTCPYMPVPDSLPYAEIGQFTVSVSGEYRVPPDVAQKGITVADTLAMLQKFAGLPGNGHVVEYTSDLGSNVWTPLPSAEFTFPLPGFSQWIDDGSLTGGEGAAVRFYRVRRE